MGLTRDFYVPDRYEFFGRNTIFPPCNRCGTVRVILSFQSLWYSCNNVHILGLTFNSTTINTNTPYLSRVYHFISFSLPLSSFLSSSLSLSLFLSLKKPVSGHNSFVTKFFYLFFWVKKKKNKLGNFILPNKVKLPIPPFVFQFFFF